MVGSNILTMLLFPLVLALAACGGAAVAGQGGQKHETFSLDEVGAHVGEHAELKDATFSSAMTDDEAIAIARDFVWENMHLENPEDLPVKTTVGLFTGEQHGSKDSVQDLPVRVVVFHDYPAMPRGPMGLNAEQAKARYTVLIDDQSGEVIYSLLSWQTEATVSRHQAIAAALGRLTAGNPGASGVEDPQNPIACLMTWGEYEERYTTGRSAMDRERPVWVVQVEGTSHSTRCLGTECPEWPYAIAVVDAETGYAFATARRFEPILLSTPEPFDPATGGAIPNTRPEKNLVEHPNPGLLLPETELPKGPAGTSLLD